MGLSCIIQFRFKQMQLRDLKDPETIGSYRIYQIAQQNNFDLQRRYIDLVHFDKRNYDQVYYALPAIESLDQQKHKRFKAMILLAAKDRINQLQRQQYQKWDKLLWNQNSTLKKKNTNSTSSCKMQNSEQKTQNLSSRLSGLLSQLSGFTKNIFSNRKKSQSLHEEKPKHQKLTQYCKEQEQLHLLSEPYPQSQQSLTPHVALPKPKQK